MALDQGLYQIAYEYKSKINLKIKFSFTKIVTYFVNEIKFLKGFVYTIIKTLYNIA